MHPSFISTVDRRRPTSYAYRQFLQCLYTIIIRHCSA